MSVALPSTVSGPAAGASSCSRGPAQPHPSGAAVSSSLGNAAPLKLLSTSASLPVRGRYPSGSVLSSASVAASHAVRSLIPSLAGVTASPSDAGRDLVGRREVLESSCLAEKPLAHIPGVYYQD